ncbi:flagellar hook-basal body complex protein [Acetobacteraceae bacterium ESL0709]|nr:flagellar hook-basal body complex protein [Acetobacteraceae bacterium ESL0697]MDF7679031.1 flagellar hook-basal body complex protein [Acetobacteraceae bacterium ESL0709]
MAGVFNALSTAVSGINAQADAFVNLSNNIANSQTTGYKATSTAFQDFVAGNNGNPAIANSHSVSASTVQHVDNNGPANNSQNALAMMLGGNGMFIVTKPQGTAGASGASFSDQRYYTKNGDFTVDKNGYMVNTSGYYLEGYAVDENGSLSNNLSPLKANDVKFRPTETSTISQNATIGKVPTDMANFDPQSYTTPPTKIYDAQHNPHNVAIKWEEDKTNPLVWTATVYDADGKGSIAPNSYQVTFNADGTMASVKDSSGNQISSSASGAPAEIPVHAKYSDGNTQDMVLSLGTIGGRTGTIMATGNNVPSTSQSDPVTMTGTDMYMRKGGSGQKIVLGTSTGSDQSYMTSPFKLKDASGNPIHDGNGNDINVALSWTQTSAAPPTWTISAVDPYNPSSTSVGKDGSGNSQTYSVVFNSAGGIESIKDASGTAVTGPLSFNVNGTSYNFNASSEVQLTTATSVDRDNSALINDSITSGKYQSTKISSDGTVMAIFDNGYAQVTGKIPVASFNNMNGLQLVDGQAYQATADSGTPIVGYVGENGGTSLNIGHIEGSTTDLTSDLSALIVAQEAYSANTKVITTADTLLQQTIAMKQ